MNACFWKDQFTSLFTYVISGFGRVILAIISFYFMPTHCVLACTCYITSALLDAFDGHAARYFNQSKLYGIIKSNYYLLYRD